MDDLTQEETKKAFIKIGISIVALIMIIIIAIIIRVSN